jgi:glutamate synthase (NADPH/NADH) large chain
MINNSRLGNKEPMLYNAEQSQDKLRSGFTPTNRANKLTICWLNPMKHYAQSPSGGMSAEGIGDGAGVNIDLSPSSFARSRTLTPWNSVNLASLTSFS